METKKFRHFVFCNYAGKHGENSLVPLAGKTRHDGYISTKEGFDAVREIYPESELERLRFSHLIHRLPFEIKTWPCFWIGAEGISLLEYLSGTPVYENPGPRSVTKIPWQPT